MKYTYFYQTKIGKLGISEDGYGITDIFVVEESNRETEKNSKGIEENKETPLLKEAAKQLEEYFLGKRTMFDLPLNPKGTEFQKKVWNVLKIIPYGTTWSYKQVAEAAGNPKASRAVGMANNKNPLMIVVPCHRVIGANGSLVGYAGGLEMKKALLNIEKCKL